MASCDDRTFFVRKFSTLQPILTTLKLSPMHQRSLYYPTICFASSSVVIGFVVSKHRSNGVALSGGLISRRCMPQACMGIYVLSLVAGSATFRYRNSIRALRVGRPSYVTRFNFIRRLSCSTRSCIPPTLTSLRIA